MLNFSFLWFRKNHFLFFLKFTMIPQVVFSGNFFKCFLHLFCHKKNEFDCFWMSRISFLLFVWQKLRCSFLRCMVHSWISASLSSSRYTKNFNYDDIFFDNGWVKYNHFQQKYYLTWFKLNEILVFWNWIFKCLKIIYVWFVDDDEMHSYLNILCGFVLVIHLSFILRHKTNR